MSQEIQTVGVRANAICGAEAETQTNDERAQRLMSHAGGRIRNACSILCRSYEPAGSTHVDSDICDGVQFLCKAALGHCHELLALGYCGGVEDVALLLQSAVSLLEISFHCDPVPVDAAFGICVILMDAEKDFDEFVRSDAKPRCAPTAQSGEVLQ